MMQLPRDVANARANQALQSEDVRNRKVGTDIEMVDDRLIMRSPNGTRYQILVTDSGLVAAALAVTTGPALPNMLAGTGFFVLTGGQSLLQNLSLSTIALKADQQTGTSISKVVTPSHQQDHDSATKAWVSFTGSTGAIQGTAYNVASVTRNGAGDYTINFATAFTDTNYAALVCAEQTAGTQGFNFTVKNGGRATGSVRVAVYNSAFALIDVPSVFVACFGRQ